MLAIREQEEAAAKPQRHGISHHQARPATPDQDDEVPRSMVVERMQSQYKVQPLRPLGRPTSLRDIPTKHCLSFKHIRIFGGIVHISAGEHVHESLPFSNSTLHDDLAILHHVRADVGALAAAVSLCTSTAGCATCVCHQRLVLPPALQPGRIPAGVRRSCKRRCMAHCTCRFHGPDAHQDHARLLCGTVEYA